MNRNRLLIVAVLFVAAAFVPAGAIAQGTASTTLAVSANVTRNCTISTSPVAFGNYDPITVNAAAGAADLVATGGVTVACTKGVAPRIDLGLGAHAAGAVRQMVGPLPADLLVYELYKETTHTNIWGSGAVDGLTLSAAPNRTARTATVYGRVLGGQDVSTGGYNDTVAATVNF